MCGFAVQFDDEQGRINFGDGIEASEQIVCLNEIIPVLLNKYLKYPEIVYKYHPKVKVTKHPEGTEYSYNMFYIPYGLLGVEFIKTHVYYSPYEEGKYDALIEVHSGTVTVVMQRNGEKEDEWDINTYVEELKVVHLKKGQKMAIPTGVYYGFVNTGLSHAVFSMVTSANHQQIDYESLKRERGLACYVICKNSKVAAVANPKYKIKTKLVAASLDKFIKNEELKQLFYGPFIQRSEPLIKFMDDAELLRSFVFAR